MKRNIIFLTASMLLLAACTSTDQQKANKIYSCSSTTQEESMITYTYVEANYRDSELISGFITTVMEYDSEKKAELVYRQYQDNQDANHKAELSIQDSSVTLKVTYPNSLDKDSLAEKVRVLSLNGACQIK